MANELETTRLIGRRFPVARWLTIVMAAWLFASTWVWARPYDARANSMIVALCMTAVALYAMFMPALRRLNTALALWLLISTLFVFAHTTPFTMWNEVIVALVVGIASLPKDVRTADSADERAFVARWARHRAR